MHHGLSIFRPSIFVSKLSLSFSLALRHQALTHPGDIPPVCLELLPILLSDLVRVHLGRPAALPTATGWDEVLRARTASVRLPRPGHSESSFRTDPSVCLIMLSHLYR